MIDDKWLNIIQVMGKTEAEEAFRPWWDSLSDYILWVSLMVNKIQLNRLNKSE